MYPINRNRRLRTSETLRNLIRENTISANDFLVPLFVIEGQNNKQEIQSMPNYFKMSIDLILKEIKLEINKLSEIPISFKTPANPKP